jgi:hypothetical protein
MKEHDQVILLMTLPDYLTKGAQGTIVHVYPSGKVYEVEFITENGNTTIALPEDCLAQVLTNPPGVIE